MYIIPLFFIQRGSIGKTLLQDAQLKYYYTVKVLYVLT